ncbi:MAG: hypothetical protein M3R70_09165 [Actinomycetota bacterium]|nr:hypothetical protein [Actinomycetota bacterium]
MALVGLALAAAEPGTAVDAWSLSATAQGVHTYVYSWTVSNSVTEPSVSLPAGGGHDLSYTVTARREKTDDGYGATVRGCAQNAGADPAHDVVLTLQLQSGASSGGPFTDVDGASNEYLLGTVAAGAEECRQGFYGTDPDSYFRNQETVTSSDAPSASATSAAVQIPVAPTGSFDGQASVSNALTSCPAGLTCGPPSVTFPHTVPSTDPGLTTDPYDEPPITYTRHIVAPSCGSASGVVTDEVTLTELDSGASEGRTAEASTSVTTAPHSCPPPPPPPPPPPLFLLLLQPLSVRASTARPATAMRVRFDRNVIIPSISGTSPGISGLDGHRSQHSPARKTRAGTP